MTNMHTVTAWDIVRRLADDADQAEHFIALQDQARVLLAQVNTEAELRTMLEHVTEQRAALLHACKFAVKELGPTSEGNQCWKAFAKLEDAIAQAGHTVPKS